MKVEVNTIYNDDCMNILPSIPDNFVDLTLTDIPYDEVNLRKSNGLRALNKDCADVITFDIDIFLTQISRITSGCIVIFCGQSQLSGIYKFFLKMQLQNLGSLRQLVWSKSNPSPMNGEKIYLSGCENAIWFKKSGAVFNAHCKSNVFTYPCGTSKLHPTEKNHDLISELICDNSDECQIVFDPCCGSGSHLLMAKRLRRKYIGVELSNQYYEIAKRRIDEYEVSESLFD